jgi:hypothetical protein
MSLVRFVSQVDPTNLQIVTKLNDEVVQDGNTNDMIFPVAEIISYLSQVGACMQSKMSHVASLVCCMLCAGYDTAAWNGHTNGDPGSECRFAQWVAMTMMSACVLYRALGMHETHQSF